MKGLEVRDQTSEVGGKAALWSPTSNLCYKRLQQLEHISRSDGSEERVHPTIE